MIDIEKYRSSFEAELDSAGEIRIGLNFSMAPSQVLFELDEEAYKEQLLEYVERLKEDHRETVLQTFPAPIAYFYQQSYSAFDNENHRLHLLRSTWESIVFILYALVLGEVCCKGFGLSDIRIFNNQKIKVNDSGILSNRLGYKIELIQRIIAYDQTNNNALDISNSLEVDMLDKLGELNQARNSISHISALSPSEAAARYEALLPVVSDLLFEMDFLSNVTIVRYVGNGSSIQDLRFNKFDGHSLQKQNYDRRVTSSELATLSPVLKDHIILVEFDDLLFTISPLIHFTIEGANLRLCYYKQMDRNTDEAIFEIIAGSKREKRILNTSLPDGIFIKLSGLV